MKKRQGQHSQRSREVTQAVLVLGTFGHEALAALAFAAAD
jgi:hypothetical protein